MMPLVLLLLTSPFGAVNLSVGPGDIHLSNPNPLEGEIVQITITVHNDGDESIPQVEDVEAWLYEGPPEDEDALRIPTLNTITGLPAGKAGTINAKWRARVGVNRIYARIDPENRIAESDETDNQAYVQIDVKPLSLPKATPQQIAEAIKKGAE